MRLPNAIFACLTILIFRTASGLKFWADYKNLQFNSDTLPKIIINEYNEFGAASEYSHPAVTCHKFRKNVLESASQLITSYSQILKTTTVYQDIWEALLKGKEKDIITRYKKLLKHAFSSDFGAFENEKTKDLPEIEKPAEKPYRWVDRCYKETFEQGIELERTDSFRSKREQYDYTILGAAYAKMLYRNGFVCLSVPELSLVVFQMFYFKVYPRSQLQNFWIGFYKELKQSMNENSELYIEDTLYNLFGYNTMVILGVDSKFGKELVDQFLATDEGRVLLFANMAELYDIVLTNIQNIEENKEKAVKTFYERLIKLEGEAVKYTLKKTSYMVFVYALATAQSAVFAPGGTGLKIIGKYDSKPITTNIENAVKKFLNLEKKEKDIKVSATIESLKSTVEFTALDKFLSNFVESVKVHENCGYCVVNFRQRRSVYDSSKKEGEGKILKKII